jgi:predicted GNAT family N-acyltransferase
MHNHSLLVCQIEFGTPEYDEALRLRYQVLREPLGLDYTAEQIAEEYQDYHIGVYAPHGALAGYLCFSPLPDQVLKMRQVAVDPNLQGKGIGKQLVLASEVFARKLGMQCIVMHARLTAVPFYLSMDYKQVGDQFEEVGVPHYYLEKEL